MNSLIFFTTNKIKLAHARHLAEEYRVVIESFRRKTFYASYIEPIIESREDLLKQSYESALAQAKNSGINIDKRFFFLEDTSVVIDALSTEEHEVPGVNIKYWMKDNEFESLDAALRKKSNRNVTVRSDMLLHIPSFYQKKWGIDEPYIVFVGIQRGSIVEEEKHIKTNLIFPWLDNKTFNKWFVPIGESKPLSCLSIEKANQYDFRCFAFSKMMSYLKEKGILDNQYEQHSLKFDELDHTNSDTLIICGFPCAGKTTLAQYLVRSYGYVHIEASDFMYLNYYLRHDVISKVKISDFAEEALKQKPEIAAQKIGEYMETLSGIPVVISGFRSMREIERLQKYLEEKRNRKPFSLGFIDASEGIRFKRYNLRNRDGQKITCDKFADQDKQQVRMGLEEIENFSRGIKIRNEHTFEEFYQAAELALTLPSKKLLNTDINLSIFKNFETNIGLEAPIFMALLSKWEDREDREYFTTTEIAKLINDLFPLIKAKYKDNVSRYFNQDFYAFYEVDPDPDENKRRYRLSNTGYGRAVSIYYRLRHGQVFK